jgi:hypothetical protein
MPDFNNMSSPSPIYGGVIHDEFENQLRWGSPCQIVGKVLMNPRAYRLYFRPDT